MRPRSGWIVLVQLLWLLPLSATQSLRGVAVADEANSDRHLATDVSAVDAEVDGASDGGDSDDAQDVQIRGPDVFLSANVSLLASNSSSFATIDQYHRDERGSFRPQPRIIGGQDAHPIHDSEHVVLLDRNGNAFCGGTMVSVDSVLTAAHCTHTVTRKGPISIVIGRHDLNDETQGEVLVVRREYLHPKYDVAFAHQKWNYDAAVMYLRRPTMTRVKIMRLNRDPSFPRPGSTVQVYGYGDTHRDPNIRVTSPTLQVANLRMVSNEQCDKITGRWHEYSVSYNGFIKDDMMCARNRKRDSCQGDSGGCLAHKNVMVGITSWGVGCNNRVFPGVYARVSAVHRWIRKNICSHSMYPHKQFECEPW